MRWHIQVSHGMLKELAAVYAQASVWSEKFLRVKRVQFDVQVRERTLDIVVVMGVGHLFIEVQSEEVTPEYVEEYFQFCERYAPNDAWLVAPGRRSETRRMTSVMIGSKPIIRLFRIIPIEELSEGLQRYYRLRLEAIRGKLVLTLDPTFIETIQPTMGTKPTRGVP